MFISVLMTLCTQLFVLTKQTKQLIKETYIPCAPGQPERVDSEYERNGIADVFMIFEPLAGRCETIVTETRTAIDFANVLKFTSDVMYPDAEKIILTTDNLNTHTFTSLYKAFPAEEAHRLASRFEWHFTPKHGSWLDMAEIEISIMCRKALAKPIADMDSFKKQVESWTSTRNVLPSTVNWQFTAADARIELKRLYPIIL